jgi:hypothetical protein
MENSKKHCESNFYDEKQNFLFVKVDDNSNKLLDHIFIHKDAESDKGFLAHFKSYDEDEPLEVYSLSKLSHSKLEHVDESLCQLNYSEKLIWHRLRIQGALPTPWKILFEQIISKL